MTRKLLLALLLLSTVNIHGQFESDHKVIIEPCMGIPNAGRLYLGMTRLIAEYDEQKVSGPPIQYGGRMEYLITKAMGVAVEANYEKSEITNYTTYYSPSLGGYQDTSYPYQITKLRVLVR